MARQRIILPEYWLDAELAQCDYVVRLFYIGTWNFSDDYGVIEDDLPKLRAQIFPYDLSIDLLPIRDRLVALKKFISFEVEGKKWLFIKNFPKYQTINHPSKWQNPKPPKEIVSEQSDNTPVALPPKRSEVKRSELLGISNLLTGKSDTTRMYWNTNETLPLDKYPKQIKNEAARRRLLPACRKITPEIEKAFNKLDYSEDDLQQGVKNYIAEILNRDPKSDYSKHRFSFYEFFKQSNGFIKFINR